MTAEINPEIASMMRAARDMLMHEHSLFASLGIKPILLGVGKTSFSMDLPAEFADRTGQIHGGLYTLLLDSIMGVTCFTALKKLQPIATINLRTDHIAMADPGSRAICTSTCDQIVGDTAYVSSLLTAENDSTLLARSSGAFMIGTRSTPHEETTKGSRL
ncbi:MAG: PaaI family thioesterase [Pseudomonadota bacterium]